MSARTARHGQRDEWLKTLIQKPSVLVPAGERSRAINFLQEKELPRFRSEAWKYTNPEYFYNQNLAKLTPEAELQLNGFGIATTEIHKKSARKLLDLYFGDDLQYTKYPLASLNTLALKSGFVVHVDALGRASARIDSRSCKDTCDRWVVYIHDGALLDLWELGGVRNRVMRIAIARGGSLNHMRIQTRSDKPEYNMTSVYVGGHARYSFSQYSLGSLARRNDIDIELADGGSRCMLNGAWRLSDQDHLDTQIFVNHIAPNTKSETVFHGVVGGRAKAIFNGRIYIAPGAWKTDARLTNKNLMESNTAEVYTKPELEIYADDVACSHGATIGHLQEDEVFYLRSRGVDEETAKSMLVNAFLREAVSHDEGTDLLNLSG